MARGDRRILARSLLASLLLALPAACSFIVDTGGLAGNEPPEGAAAPIDTDAASLGEAAAAPDTGPGRFCDAHPGALFCEDFDRLVPPSSIEVMNGTALPLAATTAPSQPNVLEAQIRALDAGEQGRGAVVSPPFTDRKIRAAFDVQFLGGSGTVVVDLEAQGTNGYFQAEILGDRGFLGFQTFADLADGGRLDGFHWGKPAPPYLSTAWMHIDMCIDIPGQDVVIAIDGKRAANGALGVGGWPASSRLRVGAVYVGTSSTLTSVRIDNVLVDTEACPM